MKHEDQLASTLPPPLLDHDSSGRMFLDEPACEVCGLPVEQCIGEVCASYDGGARTSGGGA